jgi:hypothetical protein
MTRINLVRIVLLVTLLLPGTTTSQVRNAGKWVKDGDFVQINVLCSQSWVCVPDESMYLPGDREIKVTPATSTRGSCSAAGGAADSCNACLASAPKRRCEWWLVKR